MKFRGFPPIDHPNDVDLSLGTPKPQKQRRGMDGAPRDCGTPAFKRGFAAWIDFQEQVEGACAGVETQAYQPAAGYNMALLPETQRERFDVVLVKPRNPLNIGAAARAMANFGFSRLSVVAPFAPTWREARSAVDSQDVLLNAVESATLGEAVTGATLVVGTGSLNYRKPEQRVVPLPELAPLVNQELARGGRVALVFGPEKHGLTRDDLSWCHLLVEIPTDPDQPSMNLGHCLLYTSTVMRRERPSCFCWSISSAASRSAYPSACVTIAAAIRPLPVSYTHLIPGSLHLCEDSTNSPENLRSTAS